MTKPSQLPHVVSSAHASSPGSAQGNAVRSSALQPKAAVPLSQRADAASARTPFAPPAYRPLASSQAAQAKMRGAAQASRTSPGRVAGGIIQANIVGGTHALQARLALLCQPAQQTTARAHSTAQSKSGPNFKNSLAQPQRPRTIQRKSSPGVEAFKVPLQPKSGGQPIPDQVRAKMEAAFSADFSDVRVHIGQEASAIGAIAYTWGTNIHFAPGQYNPHTLQGQKLLGHELWHVVQQKNGRVKNPFGGGVAVVQDYALEAEADRMGIKAALTQIARKKTE